MAALRPALALWLALQPGIAAAQSVGRTIVGPTLPSGAPILPQTAPGLTNLPASALPLLSAPTVLPAAQVIPIALNVQGNGDNSARPGLAKARPLARKTAATAALISKEVAASAKASGDGSRASGERQFQLLLGLKPAAPGAEVETSPAPAQASPAPAWSRLSPGRAAEPARDSEPPQPETKPASQTERSVRWMQAGTAFWKFGMDPVTVAIPLLALTALGGAVHVAALVVLYRASQIIAASLAAGIVDRVPASRVVAFGVVAQAALVTALLAVSAGGVLAPAILFPAYAAIGAATGVIETARRVVPALLLGQDKLALERYNGRQHAFYEVAGVAGALLAGAVILSGGPLAALWLQPGAAALAAWAFWKVKHPFTAAPPAQEKNVLRRAANAISAYVDDLRLGARTVFGDARFRLVALVMVLPTVVHRVFEDVLLPVFAKKVLESPASSAWLLGASNLGELFGAILLLRLAHQQGGSFRWLKLSALGLLGAWALSATTSLPIIVPIILAFSLTWAASDLSLLSLLQSEVPEKAQPRVLGFLVGLTTLIAMLGSLAVGKWLDLAGNTMGFIGANVAVTALALAVFWASRRLAGRSPAVPALAGAIGEAGLAKK